MRDSSDRKNKKPVRLLHKPSLLEVLDRNLTESTATVSVERRAGYSRALAINLRSDVCVIKRLSLADQSVIGNIMRQTTNELYEQVCRNMVIDTSNKQLIPYTSIDVFLPTFIQLTTEETGNLLTQQCFLKLVSSVLRAFRDK